MVEFDSISELFVNIKNDLLSDIDKKSIALLYAFNSTGKTRLSIEFDELNENDNGYIKVLSYNAFLEDLFVWDNKNLVLNFSPDDWRIRFIQDQGLENKIVENFKLFTNSKVEPIFEIETHRAELDKFILDKSKLGGNKIGKISFFIASGDGKNKDSIKISKSEESILIWSVFYSILEIVIEELNTPEEHRSTNLFNHLEYIVIDDPVSSIDDERIISLAVKLCRTIKLNENRKINFLITTHHALFFNVLFNSFKKFQKSDVKKYCYILSKNGNIFILESQKDDSPFAYHILVKNKLKEAIKNGSLEKYHFNLFRTLLEKTANFLGYTDWGECIYKEENREEVKRLINLYSHSKLSELESGSLSNADKELFANTFNSFMEDFKYK